MLDGNAPDEPLNVGDLCATGENRYPRYRVIALVEDRAWIRDVSTGRDAVVEARHCHRLADRDNREKDAPAPRSSGHEGTGPSPVFWPDGTPRP